jgi:HSP90 family molecular chaperone
MPEKFRANIKDMIGLIADRLYNNTADIVIRELVQNSYDSINRRHAQKATEKGTIVFATRSSPPTLTVTDNGEGMDDNELRDYLSVLGQSLKRLSAQSAGGSSRMIGEYGIGFFSCFMIADTITVRTRKPGSKILFTWHSEGVEEYSIVPQPAGSSPEGTSVELLLQRGSTRFADPAEVTQVLHRFCRSLDCSIFLNDRTTPINPQTFPWELPSPQARRKWLEQHYGDPVHFRVGTSEHKGLPFGYALSYSKPDDAEQEIYCKRMFVTSRLHFIPEQFEFINVLTNCDSLKLNLARDNVTSNTAFEHLREGLEDLLWIFLGELLASRKETPGLETYLKDLQPGMHRRCLADPKLLKKCAPYLLFHTTTPDHPATIPEYLQAPTVEDRKVLFITKSKAGADVDRLLLLTCEAKRIPVILVASEDEEQNLRLVCVLLKAKMTPLDKAASTLFSAVATASAQLGALRANFARFLNRPVRFGKVTPPVLPLLLCGDEVILNEENPLIRHLAKLQLQAESCRSIYLRCFEDCRTLDASRLEKNALEAIIQSITSTFMSWGDELAKAVALNEKLAFITDRWWLGASRSAFGGNQKGQSFHREGRKYSIRCFVICPFQGAFRDVINVCKQVCTPLGIYAETAEEPDTRDILTKVCLKIHECDFAIVDVSESRPNVLFELGLLLARRKPAIILRNMDTAEKLDIPVPADIIQIERIDYLNTSEDLTDKLNLICRKIVRAPPQCP